MVATAILSSFFNFYYHKTPQSKKLSVGWCSKVLAKLGTIILRIISYCYCNYMWETISFINVQQVEHNIVEVWYRAIHNQQLVSSSDVRLFFDSLHNRSKLKGKIYYILCTQVRYRDIQQPTQPGVCVVRYHSTFMKVTSAVFFWVVRRMSREWTKSKYICCYINFYYSRGCQVTKKLL